MPRPRRVSDEAVFAAFDRAVGHHGPSVTLAQVASEAGMTAPALIQRFGSRAGLFSAFMRQELAAQPTRLASLAAAHAEPLEAVLALAGTVADYSATRAAYLRHLSSFLLQLAEDETLAPVIAAWFTAERRWIAGRLLEAVAEGTLAASTPVPALSRAVQAALLGARFQWAAAGDASSEPAWTRAAVQEVLALHRG